MTPRDEEIVSCLTSKVRFFSLEQIAREWWADTSNGIDLARKRMTRLERADWVKGVRALVRPLLALERPVVTWQPHELVPDFPVVSSRLRARWKYSAREVELYLATPRASRVFGGSACGYVKNLCQTTHDLHVAEVFLRYRRLDRELAAAWMGEDAASRRDGGKVPDALLVLGGKIVRAVEFGGAYPVDRLAELHAECAEKSLPYEVW